MKRTHTLLISLIVVAIAGSSCRQNTGKDPKPTVAVSILPLKYLVDNISGGAVETMVMLPPGTGHESYDPAPRQMAELARAKIYFTTGHTAFDETWLPNLAEQNPQMRIKILTDGIDLIAGTCDHTDHDGSEHQHGVDPHFWLSPKSYGKMAGGVLEELSRLFPDQEPVFRHRYDSIVQVIAATDSLATQELRDLKNRRFMVFHPALTYFARDYQLEQVAIEEGGKAPGASGLKKIIDQAKAENIRVVLVQREYDTAVAASVAREINGKTLRFDPMAYDWPENMKLIIDILGQNLPE